MTRETSGDNLGENHGNKSSDDIFKKKKFQTSSILAMFSNRHRCQLSPYFLDTVNNLCKTHLKTSVILCKFLLRVSTCPSYSPSYTTYPQAGSKLLTTFINILNHWFAMKFTRYSQSFPHLLTTVSNNKILFLGKTRSERFTSKKFKEHRKNKES